MDSRIVILLLLITPIIEVNAALQANPNTQYKKLHSQLIGCVHLEQWNKQEDQWD